MAYKPVKVPVEFTMPIGCKVYCKVPLPPVAVVVNEPLLVPAQLGLNTAKLLILMIGDAVIVCDAVFVQLFASVTTIV